jgi:hypothetical protein
MSLMVFERGLLYVVTKTEQMKERNDNVDWASDNADDLIAEENGSVWHNPW